VTKVKALRTALLVTIFFNQFLSRNMLA